ncbi:MAG: trypsin-like peptidase domain-containing protein [Patescibacteria group bacterium]
MKNKTIIFIAIVALIGGIAGSLISAPSAEANLFKDFFNKFFQLVQPEPQSENLNANDRVSPPTPAIPYAPTVDYEQAVIKAVEDSSPTVVSIIISKDVAVIEQCPYDPFGNLPQEFRDFFGQNFEMSQPCEKGTKRQEVGGGSGFIVSKDGLIVTNKHVVADTEASYTVFTGVGKKYEAKVLARDSVLDLALIKIKADNLPFVKLGNSDSIKLGQTAIAIGNALGEFRNTVSTGVISGLSRTVTASGGETVERIENVIQTDAAINPGNSGGPLLNLKGEVIGINVAMVSGAQSIGFALPINQAKKAIESVQRTGRIVAPYLGVRYLIIDSEMAKKEKLSVENGALVRGDKDGAAVMQNSPASKVGLQAEDIIIEINNEKINQDHSLAMLIKKYSVGDTVTLKILRNGKTLELKVALEERTF